MSVTVTDQVGVLTLAQKTELQGINTPHKVKAFFENPGSKQELHEHVQSCVDSPNTICIGMSPKLRHVWTEIGIDTGIRSGDYQQVGRAGNQDFKAWLDGNDTEGLVNGVKDIVSRAQVLAHRETAQPVGLLIQEHNSITERPVSPWPFVIGFGILAGFVGVVWFFVHRAQKRTQRALENAERENAELAQRNIRDQKWADEIEKRVEDKPSTRSITDTNKIVQNAKVERERKSTWDDVIERAKPKTPPRGRVELPPAPAVPRERSYSRGRTRTPSPVIVVPQIIPVPYSPPSYTRADTPLPTRRKADTPAPSTTSPSSFGGFSGGGGGGDIGGGGFSGGGGGGDL